MSTILRHIRAALVRIWNTGLKHAARGSVEMQDPKISKKSPSGHHRTTLLGCIFGSKALIYNREKLVKQQYSPPHVRTIW